MYATVYGQCLEYLGYITLLHSQKANLRIFLAQPSKSLVTNHMYGCEPQLTKMHINADPGQQMQMVEDSAAQWG